MLATLGFVITGICFGIFAYTFHVLVLRKANLRINLFCYAYYSLALALLSWGVAVATGDAHLLKISVIVGDGLLLLGTLFMIGVWLDKQDSSLLVPLACVAIALLYIRSGLYPPTPYVSSGILIFDTQAPVAIILCMLFALIWLPISINTAKRVAHAIGQERIVATYSAMYAASIVSAVIFLAARRTLTVVISFTALAVCFVMLIGSNVLITKIVGQQHGK